MSKSTSPYPSTADTSRDVVYFTIEAAAKDDLHETLGIYEMPPAGQMIFWKSEGNGRVYGEVGTVVYHPETGRVKIIPRAGVPTVVLDKLRGFALDVWHGSRQASKKNAWTFHRAKKGNYWTVELSAAITECDITIAVARAYRVEDQVRRDVAQALADSGATQ